jgi:hypothetical protein
MAAVESLQPEFDHFTLRDDGVLLFLPPGNDFAGSCIPSVAPPVNLHLFLIRDHRNSVTSGHLGIANDQLHLSLFLLAKHDQRHQGLRPVMYAMSAQ